VNDDPDLLELLVTGLEREAERLTVRTATSAQDALEIFDDEPIDCILSDHHMLGQTGVELLRSVRAEDDGIPFIMFTETGSEVVASEAIAADVTDYIIRQTLENQHPLVARRIVTYVERHRMEKRAAAADERLHELASMSNDVLWMFSADWDELLFVNDAYESVFGRPAETLYAAPESFLDPVHPDDLDRVKLAMKRASEGKSQQIEFRIEHPSSLQRWVESHCKPIVAGDGRVQRVTGFTRDVTERKNREREIAKRNEKLDQFTSTVAHDLRNPLNVVNGHLDIARRECDSDHLKTCSHGIERMNDMLEDLLSLARMGESIGELTTVDFGELVRASGTNTATGRQTLEIAESARIRCDPNRLKEAFENLLRNASEHNSQPVTVTAGTLPDRSGVYIEDDGKGIPESQQEQVFESGYTTLKEGTGFGLSIVEQIVGAHGWHIDVRTAASGGTRFEITGVAFVD